MHASFPLWEWHQRVSPRMLLLMIALPLSPLKARPEQVIQNINFSQIHFTKAADNRVNFGLVGSEYNYILLKVNTTANNENLYLLIDNTSLDTLSVYRIYNNRKSSLVYRAGTLVPFDQRNKYVWHTDASHGNK